MARPSWIFVMGCFAIGTISINTYSQPNLCCHCNNVGSSSSSSSGVGDNLQGQEENATVTYKRRPRPCTSGPELCFFPYSRV